VIVQLLRSLAAADRTVLIATHDDSIARQADEVIDMRDGRFVGASAPL
jgi:ABC-type lipoprotein export system ATPase subunit